MIAVGLEQHEPNPAVLPVDWNINAMMTIVALLHGRKGVRRADRTFSIQSEDRIGLVT